MKQHPSFLWDPCSDQPFMLRDKKLKRKIYRSASWQIIKSLALLPLLPVFFLLSKLRKCFTLNEVGKCLGVSVHMEMECEGKTIVPLEQVQEMVDDLGVRQVLVRIHLADRENFDRYIEHIDALKSGGREVTVNLVQSRLLLDDFAELRASLDDVLPRLQGKVEYLHVGNAYNRRKWAFAHFGEYFKFFQAVRAACEVHAPEMKLVGGSVIDFELVPVMESLFNFRRGHYDGYGVQLYVDRRGAPENCQGSFDFIKKINIIDLMRGCSWKAKGDLWLTEFNWPLKDAAPFAPCIGDMLVSPEEQADFLARSYLLAIASGRMRTCYWHQLVAPGFGMVDNRGDKMVKYPSYFAFKTLNSLLNDASVIAFNNGDYESKDGLYSLKLKKVIDGKSTIIHALWCAGEPMEIQLTGVEKWVDISGEDCTPEDDSTLTITGSVVYALIPG